ncbi:hypothetical protein [Pseudomonas sp. C27(2019)]|uniref:hypothetical protein n=1 Tax=Pseudomonas sp. C27(2019) TaxID=2604941 RepID=UPI0021141FBB|nr:hypothetical protein [Pseudomonas sp. C27(2019)]
MDHTDTTLTLALSDAIGNNDFDSALAAVKSLRPVDLADVLEQLEPTLCWRLLERLPKRAEVFSYIEADEQVRLAVSFRAPRWLN